ncbi:GntR family transcriptional regulator [Sandaracinomonas limnophila]|uniref:GntR family transcriptional regulator n=1 Tax=Sandaracinomonas limnophila TaxID=1862386 RepID=A0A437PWZ8_9BACT|nr:GntR family transcriptional regulator [Sandaracinomonas limnophila]RVU26738.1 GntR family transcriptional regulator [Sandaracinomonas limnophila]
MIKFDPNSSKPKYVQLIDGIVDAIDSGDYARGQQLPSINVVANEFGMARMTVTKAYDELKERGLISSHHGKGFYVTSTDTRSNLHLFILMDALTPYKEILLENILEGFNGNVSYNLFFHYHDIKLFETLISDNIGKYNHYIILPHFNISVSKILSKIPKDKLLILDIDVKEFGDEYAILYQNFETNIYEGLEACLEKIKKYNTINLVLSQKSFQYTPQGIIQGFTKFCQDYSINHDIIPDLEEEYDIQQGQAYIVFREFDLIKMINWCKKKSWDFGRDIGVISYDDTPLKEIISEGISVISNDFSLMGKRAAEIIINKEKGRIANAFYFHDRNSL